MAPMMIETHQEQQQQMQQYVPNQKGISLQMLIDNLLQQTFHDLSVLSELLPRKSDIERKIEIIKFATKARQQFIRILALVKWAAGEDRVDKFQAMSMGLLQQNEFYIHTADTLFHLSRGDLVNARLPNFSLPTAVDVLTTGTFNRLPKCIRKIVPEEPISATQKAQTLKNLNEVIQHRLVTSKIPPEFNSIKIGDGKLVLRVEHEFEAVLMLPGDGADIPWRLLHIDFLMEDYETGDGRSLVHGMQVHFIHQIVQSRLMVQEDSLAELYNTLHNFCLSLHLEVLHTQSKRLINERWGEHVRVEEYVPAEKLTLSFFRASARFVKPEKKPPSVCITQSKEKKQALIMRYVPPLGDDDDGKSDNGIYISPDCLSIEKIFAIAVRSYSISMLKNLLGQLSVDEFFKENAALNLDLPSLEFKPFQCCMKKESVSVSIDSRTGFLLLNVGVKNPKVNLMKQLQIYLRTDIHKFIEEFHALRCSLYLEKSRSSVYLQPVIVFEQFPVKHCNLTSLQRVPKHRLFLQFKKHPDYFLVLGIDISNDIPSKPIKDKYYLVQAIDNPEISHNDSINSTENMDNLKIANCFQLNTDTLLNKRKITEKLPVEGPVTPVLKNDIREELSLMKRKERLQERAEKRKRLECANEKVKVVVNNEIEEDRHLKEDSLINNILSSILLRSIQRIPFIELCKQLVAADILFHGVLEESHGSPNIILLDYPTPPGCNKKDFESFKEQILNSTMYLDVELSQWVLTFSFKKPLMESCCEDVRHKGISFDYNLQCGGVENQEKKESFLADRILSDLRGLFRLYKHAINVDQYLKALNSTYSISTFVFKRYDMKSLVFTYSRVQGYEVTFSYDREKEYQVTFMKNGNTKEPCPHSLTQEYIQQEFNRHQNLQYSLKVIHDTYAPLKAICRLTIIPELTLSNRALQVVNNFTVIAHSSTQINMVYRNAHVLDLYLMESSVLIKDGTLYLTDTTKAMRGFNPIPQLTAFLHLYAEKYSGGSAGLDYPVTPGGMELDQSTDNYSQPPSNHASIVISSPQPFNQFTAPSPGNPASVPSPGTFLQQPSPAAIGNAMSPSTWPGSPPLVQGSPHPARQNTATPQSRMMLSSINVTHAYTPVLLTHESFKMLLKPDNDNKENSNCVCPLEKFFGSIQLRSHLIRVLRNDDTLKHEKTENGVVVFSSCAGKIGPENGLQYSISLNQATMDYLVLRVTPARGHEAAWQIQEELSILEQYFEHKVASPPFRVTALTSFARILGAQQKILKDFMKVFKLEMQSNWADYHYRVEVVLTIPPPIVLPGTSAVALKTKNLLFLQLTDLQNEENIVVLTLVHEVRTNLVHALEYIPLKNVPAEPTSWAVRARSQVITFLNQIAQTIAQRDFPIFRAVSLLVTKFQVKDS